MLGSKKGLIIISLTSLLMATTVIATATYALYSDKVTVNTHITSGSQDVSFKKVAESGKVINTSTGLLEDYSNENEVDLKTNPAQVFNLTNFVPCSTINYTFEVKNIGTVAFDYSLTFVFDETIDAFTTDANANVSSLYQSQAEAFMAQIKLEVSKGTTSIYDNTLYNYYKSTNKKLDINSLLVNESDTIDVKLSFINDENNVINNYVQDTTLVFDLSLDAIQKIGE